MKTDNVRVKKVEKDGRDEYDFDHVRVTYAYASNEIHLFVKEGLRMSYIITGLLTLIIGFEQVLSIFGKNYDVVRPEREYEYLDHLEDDDDDEEQGNVNESDMFVL